MDTTLISMPKTLHEFLIAVAVAQDYSIQLAVGVERKERTPYYAITFRMDEQFKCFEPVLRVVQNNVPTFDYSGWDVMQRGEFDCFINFDFDRGKHLARKVGKHITVGFNAMFGTGALPWPVLKAMQLEPPKKNIDVLVLGQDPEYERLYQFIGNNYPELELLYDGRDFKDFTPEEVIEYINHFRIVIGPHSAETYLALSLNKPCIETFSNKENVVLYSSSGKPNYKIVVGEYITAEYLWTVWEELWPELLSSTSSPVVSNKVVSPVSTADNVEEKLSVPSSH